MTEQQTQVVPTTKYNGIATAIDDGRMYRVEFPDLLVMAEVDSLDPDTLSSAVSKAMIIEELPKAEFYPTLQPSDKTRTEVSVVLPEYLGEEDSFVPNNEEASVASIDPVTFLPDDEETSLVNDAPLEQPSVKREIPQHPERSPQFDLEEPAPELKLSTPEHTPMISTGPKANERTIDLLKQRAHLDRQQIRECEKFANTMGKSIVEIAYISGYLTAKQANEIYREAEMVASVSATDPRLVQAIGATMMENLKLVPAMVQAETFYYYSPSEIHQNSIEEKNLIGRLNNTPGFSISRTERVLKDTHGVLDQLVTHKVFAKSEIKRRLKALNRGAQDEETELLLKSIIVEAFTRRASDIHIIADQATNLARIQYSIGNSLFTAHTLANRTAQSLVTHCKSLSQLDTASVNESSDGRFEVNLFDLTIDVRLHVEPAINGGQDATLRLLDPFQFADIDEIFLHFPHVSERLTKYAQEMRRSRPGLVLATGSVNMGKSTTLNALLMRAPRHKRRIVECSQPVEATVPLVSQTQVESEKDYKPFLVSALRRGIDCVKIGELRTPETVMSLLEIVESGHVGLSTIHADSSLQSLERIIHVMVPENDRDITAQVLGESMDILLNQKLVECVCQHCSTPTTSDALPSGLKKYFEETTKNMMTLRRASNEGCEFCNSGYTTERTLVPEVIEITPLNRRKFQRYVSDVKQLNDNDDIEEFYILSRKQAVCTLASKGILSIQQIEHLLPTEWMVS